MKNFSEISSVFSCSFPFFLLLLPPPHPSFFGYPSLPQSLLCCAWPWPLATGLILFVFVHKCCNPTSELLLNVETKQTSCLCQASFPVIWHRPLMWFSESPLLVNTYSPSLIPGPGSSGKEWELGQCHDFLKFLESKTTLWDPCRLLEQSLYLAHPHELSRGYS